MQVGLALFVVLCGWCCMPLAKSLEKSALLVAVPMPCLLGHA